MGHADIALYWPGSGLPQVRFQAAAGQRSERHRPLANDSPFTYVCPDDTPQINEPRPGELGWNNGQGSGGIWNWDVYSRVRLNYAACYGNAGYNQTPLGGVAFLGGMFTNGQGYSTASIKDGTSNTLAFSEVLPGHGPYYVGPPGDGMLCEGGQAFEGYVTPNSSAAGHSVQHLPAAGQSR